LLREHSGLGGRAVYDTAKAVECELERIGVASFKFISYLANGIDKEAPLGFNKRFPDIFLPKEAEQFLSPQKITFQPRVYYNDISKLNKNPVKILSPLIHEQSATIIYGDEYSGKSWFAVNLAFAISLGQKPFSKWLKVRRDCEVLFLSAEDGKFSLGEKLSKIAVIYLNRSSDCSISCKKYGLPRFSIQEQVPNEAQEQAPNEAQEQAPNEAQEQAQSKEKGQVPSKFPFNKDERLGGKSLFWNITDVNCNQSIISLNSNEIAPEWGFNFVIDQIDKTNLSQSEAPKIVFIDNFFSASPGDLSTQNALIHELRKMGWTVVIILRGKTSTRQKMQYCNRVAVDNLIKITKSIDAEPDEIKMDVFIEKGIGLEKGKSISLCAL
jgi:hypothetical protein